MKYLLDMEQLKQGDIVLEDGESKFSSNMIKKATSSKYSHAMIYTGHTLIHATTGGVFSKNPQRILKDKKSSFKVLRSKTPLSELTLKKICDDSRSKVGSIYSKIEAGKSILPNNKAGSNTKQFCSRLVAQSYYKAGIIIVANVDYCTPEDINQSLLLEEVLDCVKQATDADLEMAEKFDPNIQNQEETLKWLKSTRKLLKTKNVDIQTINDVTEYLSKDNSEDKRICKYIESTKYLNLYKVDRNLNPYRYCEKEFNTYFETLIDANKALTFELNLNFSEIDRHSQNLRVHRDNYNKFKLKYTKLHIKLCRNILKENYQRLKVIKQYSGIGASNMINVDKALNELVSLLQK
jgi:hypothetical protein